MAIYRFNPGDLALGTGVPAGFTQRWHTTGQTYNVFADASSPSGQSLNVTVGGTPTRAFLGYDAVNADPDRDTVDILALCRVNFDSGGSNPSWAGLAGRGSGDDTTETGDTGVFAVDGFLRNINYASGSGAFNSTGTDVWDVGVLYYLRVQISGTTITTTLYPENDPLGAAIDSISTTANASNANNWIGIFSFADGADVDFLYMGVGTGADTAPLYEADTTNPVLTSPTATATGDTTADGSVSVDEGDATLYWIASTSSTKPSEVQIQAGQDNTGSAAADSGNQYVASAGVQNVSVTGLTAETPYYLHFQCADAAGNNSTVVTSSSFTTDAAAVAVKGIRVNLNDGATDQANLTGITAIWWDSNPRPTASPVFHTDAATTDANGDLILDLDASTALNIGDSGFLIAWKPNATITDSLGALAVIQIEDVS